MTLHRYQFQPLDKKKLVNPDTESSTSKGLFAKGAIGPVLSLHAPSPPPENEPPTAISPEPPILIGYREEDLLKSRTDGYEEGYAKGFHAAKSETEAREQQVKETVRALLQAIQSKEVESYAAHESHIEALVQALFHSARVLAGVALERFASDEIRRVVTETITQHYNAPELTLFIADQLLSDVLHWIETVRTQLHFTGTIHVHGVANMALSDCRVEWKGGGVTREWSTLEAKLFEALTQTVRGIAPHE